MRLILSVDAISPPLTGVGRYALELAKGLSKHPAIASLRFYLNGRWVAESALLLQASQPRAPGGRRKRVAPPRWYRNWQRSRAFRDCVFHSPNYFLPASTDLAVATVHDLSVLRFPETHPIARRRQFDAELARTLERASHLITPSESIRKEVIEYFSWPHEKITAVPNGVAQCFSPLQAEGQLIDVLSRYGVTPGGYGLCVATLEPRKKIDALLMAYRNLPVALRRLYPLALVGHKGWLSEDLHDLIEKGQSEGWVRYFGFVPEADLPALYAGARAFFYPSLYEGFGLPVLEAMASGTPVLTSDSSSLPEVSGGAALLINPGDGDALCRGIEKALLDDDWRSSAREKGLEVAGRFTWESCVERTICVYQGLLGPQLGPPISL